MKPYFEIDGIQLYHGDCREVLPSLPGPELLLTSPPYNCGMEYEGFNDSLSPAEFWKFTAEWLARAFAIMPPGSRAAVNLPWWMGKKPRADAPGEFKRLAEEIGLTYIDKIIWFKGDESNVNVSGGFGGGGSGWGTYMSPSGPAIRCATEPILIFSSGPRGRGIVSGEGRGQCVRGDITKEEFLEWTIDAWFLRGASDKVHPAAFPKEIPERLIKLYTYPGELVCDPFAGSGTTLQAARDLGRRAIGIELTERYCELTASRLEQRRFAFDAR